jgi:stress up-regulated protein Nod 19
MGMKMRHLAIVLVGAALACGACVPLQNAPAGGGGTVTSTYRLGPFAIAPGGEAMGTATNIPRPAGQFGLQRASFTLVDEHGVELPRHMFHLHHVLLIDPDTPDHFCPGRGERFAGSGAERTELRLGDPYVYLVANGEPINALYHIMNMNMSGSATNVYLQYTLTYEPGATAANSRPVTPYFLDVTGCGGSTYDVPGTGGPNSTHLKTRTFTAPADGIAVFVGGHQHDGAQGIKLVRVKTGTVGCDSEPTFDDMQSMDGFPAAMSSCRIHDQVVAGEQYRVESRYDNSMPHVDVMGIMLAYVWLGHH